MRPAIGNPVGLQWERTLDQTIYGFGPFRLHTHIDLMLRGTEPVALGRRAITLLRALVERPGAVVSKDALLEAVWPGQEVEESNLTVQIAALRRVLGTEPGGERWVQTMPRRGYRFVGPVVTKEESGGTAAPPARAEGAQSRHEAERRQITAMSCELADVTAGAGSVDLEDLRQAVGNFQRCIAEAAGRHHGFVYRYLGNSVLVLFGYPAAHEHDAEEAVRAGLELCAAVRTLRAEADPPMQCRVGVATGTVIMGDFGGSASLGDPEIVGDAPGLAVRLQASGQPDAVAIGPVTRRLVGNLFDCRELGAIETNNGAAPMRIWQVLAESVVESRFEALRGSVLSPLVGRDEEIDLLLRRWGHAKAGDGEVVLVSGEAGIGKSRIAVALEERLSAEPHLRLRCFCSPHHQDSALYPFIDQIGRAAGFARDDPPSSRLEKLERVLARAAPPDGDVALLADLLSLPGSERHPLPNLSPQRKKERTLEALLRQLEASARQRPVVMVFEDAHWIDPTSRELLDLTVERVRSLPVLLIVTFRPEFQPPWTGQPRVTVLALNRLDRRDRTALIAQIAVGKALPNEIVEQIADRTDGVPLFVEELTKSVLESGLLREEGGRFVLDRKLPALAIPTTLHASLLARLDRLASVRRVAQIGAAIGREFSYEVLNAVSRVRADELQAALAGLVASELVFQRGTPPGAVYSFKHALVQDAAYNSLVRSRRITLHASIGDVLERDAELAATQPALLGHHFAEAGAVEKAASYFLRAGEQAAANSAMPEAQAHLMRGLALADKIADGPVRSLRQAELTIALGNAHVAVHGFGSAEHGAAFADAVKLCRTFGLEHRDAAKLLARSLFGHWVFVMSTGELAQSHAIAEEFLEPGRDYPDPEIRAGAATAHGNSCCFLGRLQEGARTFAAAVADREIKSHAGPMLEFGLDGPCMVYSQFSRLLACQGFLEQAEGQARAALERGRRLNHLPTIAFSLATACTVAWLMGDLPLLRKRSAELVQLTVEQGYRHWRARGTGYAGWVLAAAGKLEEGRALLAEDLAELSSIGIDLLVPQTRGMLADVHERMGQADLARAARDEGLGVCIRTGEAWFEAELHRGKGEALHNDPAAAEACFRAAIDIARAQSAKLFELRAAVSLARLRRDQGRHAEAHDLLAPIYGWFTEGFDTSDLKDAKALLDELQ